MGTTTGAQSSFVFDELESETASINATKPLHRKPLRRLLGAFYTPQSAAEWMADWVLRHDGESVLEPSFGKGIFLKAVEAGARCKGFTSLRVFGVEIDKEILSSAVLNGLLDSDNATCSDFLSVSPFKVQAVVGNPPYVRLRHIPKEQRHRALHAAKVTMGTPMDPSGSLWMSFVLHTMRFLDEGGRMAFVLPYDFTYVRYAQPLWKKLRASFGSLQVLRTHERLFPDLLQDVVILLADNYGSQTNVVSYQAFERVADLLGNRPIVDEILHVDEVQRGERTFLAALLGDELRQLLSTRVANTTVSARRLATFNIGYVAGDKRFFHPTREDVEYYEILDRSLRPALTATRALKGRGLRTSSLIASEADRLFAPGSQSLTAGERRYIAMGVETEVSQRYKCRIRHPWYVVPGVKVPDITVSVFSERPILMINDADYVASNSLLCGYCIGATREEVATAWYTSLTLLQCELEVHALGGGVMIMVPREAGNIRLPSHVQIREKHLSHLDSLLCEGKIAEAYRAGDREVLRQQLGFSTDEIALIRHGIETLSHWRTSARSSRR